MVRGKPRYDVVLVQPSVTWVYDPFEHLGLAYLAAALRRQGFTVLIVDAVLRRLNMAELYQELDQYDIGVLGVTLISHGYVTTTRFLELYRDHHPATRVVAGGHFATFAAEKIFAHTRAYDAIALGEAEHSFPAYCRSVLRGEGVELQDIATPGEAPRRSHERILDMDALPFPARDCLPLAQKRGASASITASRGCYARCAFCTVPSFYAAKNGPRWVSRSIDNIIAELSELHGAFGVRHFSFIDDNFMGPGRRGRERALEFAAAYDRSGLPMTFHIDCRASDVDELVLAALKEVGLRSVFIGIESVSRRDLVVYRKDLDPEANWNAVRIVKKLDLNHTLAMIMFNPETDERSILDNVAFLKWAGYFPRNPLAIVNLYEGTELNRRFEPLLEGPFWDYRFRFARESTRIIYDEALRFCKETLPLERELSADGDRGRGRGQVHELRLLFLEELTARLGQEPVEDIHQRYRARLAALRAALSAGAQAPAARGGDEERAYMTGSPLDAPPVEVTPEPELAAAAPAQGP